LLARSVAPESRRGHCIVRGVGSLGRNCQGGGAQGDCRVRRNFVPVFPPPRPPPPTPFRIFARGAVGTWLPPANSFAVSEARSELRPGAKIVGVSNLVKSIKEKHYECKPGPPQKAIFSDEPEPGSRFSLTINIARVQYVPTIATCRLRNGQPAQ